MAGCLFCGIVRHEIPGRIVYEDETCVAFEDINPQAPHHVLVVPRRHIATLRDLTEGDAALFGRLMLTAANVAQARGLTDFRIVVNCGAMAGQSVFHIHLHLLAGRQMSWPPG